MRCLQRLYIHLVWLVLITFFSHTSICAQSVFTSDTLKTVPQPIGELPLSAERLDSLLNLYASPNQDAVLLQPIRSSRIPYWIFIIFLFLFSLITLIRFRYTKEFKDTFTVFVNNSTFQQVYREALVSGIRPGYVLMNINFITLTALWIYFYSLHNIPTLFERIELVLPVSWGIIAALLALRFLLIHLTGYIITKARELKFFHFTELHIFRAGGILLFPLILMQFYAPNPISRAASVASIIIFITFFLYRYLRAYSIVSQAYGKNLFHFLIYICALEIAPVLIGVKLILKNIQ
jgi:hypothetical protein